MSARDSLAKSASLTVSDSEIRCTSSGSLVAGDLKAEPKLEECLEEKGEDTTERTAQTFYLKYFRHSWAGEITAWLLSALCLAVISIILVVYHDKGLENWDSRITINTLVNFVSQLAQTSLVIPAMSSIAQLKWLWFLKSRLLGDIEDFDDLWIAALNPLLILLLGPLTQQTVKLKVRQAVAKEEQASLPKVDIYRSETFADFRSLGPGKGKEEFSPAKYATASQAVKSQIAQGLVDQTANLSEVPVTCSTSNCTFPRYHTLGLCYATEDYTSHVVSNCSERTGPTQPDSDRSTRCSCTVDVLQDRPPFPFDNFTTGKLWIGTPGEGWSPKDIGTANPEFVETYVIYRTNLSSSDERSSIQALRVALRLCIYLLETVVVSGQTRTTLIETLEPLSWHWRYENVTKNATDLIEQDEDLASNDNDRSHFTALTSISGGAETQEFGMQGSSKAALTNDFVRGLFGYWDRTSPQEIASSDAARPIGRAMYDQLPSGQLVFHGIERYEQMLNNTVIRLTNVFRTTSQSLSYVEGQAMRMEVFISVDFWWLVLPIATVLSTLILLLIVMLQSRRYGVPPWKSSQLDTMRVLALGAKARLDEDKNRGAKTHVVLARDVDQRWTLTDLKD